MKKIRQKKEETNRAQQKFDLTVNPKNQEEQSKQNEQISPVAC